MQKKLKKLKMLILDVDGIMTDARVFWLKGLGWTRVFHIKDGYGIRLMVKNGFEIAVISGGESDDLHERMKVLGITEYHCGNEDKLIALEKILSARGLKAEHVGYMGDELFDIPVLERAGFSATVPHAVDEVKKRVDYVTKSEGGAGAVREVIDAIRKAQKIGPYLS